MSQICVFQVEQTQSLGDHLGTDLSFSPDTGFSDVTLVCGERNFGCHKVILSKRSDVFAAMFSHSDTEESKTNKVTNSSLESLCDLTLEVYVILPPFENGSLFS